MTVEQEASADKGELERDMHRGFDEWAPNHSERFSSIGTLPYDPERYPDQKIDKAKRPITRFSYLRELGYIKTFKTAYAKSVGSRAVANCIIEGFKITPAHAYDESLSMTDFVHQNLEQNLSTGVASGHADSLNDITDFTAGLSLSVAEEHGGKYLRRFGVVVNKNMTRETYEVFGRQVSMPRLISLGLNVYWGLPADGAKIYHISEEAVEYVNRRTAGAVLADRKEKGIVVGVVPAGSGMIKDPRDGPLKRLLIKDASDTAPLFIRFDGGVLPVNRFGDEIAISSIIKTGQPEMTPKKVWARILTDQIMEEHALQVSELAGVPVDFQKLSVPGAAGRVSINTLAGSET